MIQRVGCVIIGAGVIGLAVARRLAMAGIEVIALEAAATIGTQTSSRNSEIIHAGIYYPTGSLKAKYCVEGRRDLYDYCESHGVDHRRCGKFIVATRAEEIPGLERLHRQAAANGVADLEWCTPAQVHEFEPAVYCTAALWSPSTGIIDSHGLMLAYQADAEAAGAQFAFHSPVSSGRIEDDGLLLSVHGDEPLDIKADLVINAAGLQAGKVAQGLLGLESGFVPPIHYAKGSYFSVAGKPPFSRPIYPLPDEASLGIHATVDRGGQVRFGPDVEWIDHIDYAVDPQRAKQFYRAVRKYYPALGDGTLVPAFCGIRPKLSAPGEAAADFVIQGPATHGVNGLVNLFGIDSPGLTASLAIAEGVADMLIGC